VSPTDTAPDFFEQLHQDLEAECGRLRSSACTLDIYFFCYLRRLARFGYFTYGPINIDVSLIETIVERTTPRLPDGVPFVMPNWEPDFDFLGFSQSLMEEVKRSGRRRIDELHFLLAFMKVDRGLPARVFGELGVTREQVEEFGRTGAQAAPVLEKLFSPEEAAEYLNIHVQTVRAWIRSGRLRARRLAGQRALRITASDLQSVLEPVSPGEV
jgi:excisionase family DNA binding protein